MELERATRLMMEVARAEARVRKMRRDMEGEGGGGDWARGFGDGEFVERGEEMREMRVKIEWEVLE